MKNKMFSFKGLAKIQKKSMEIVSAEKKLP